LWHASRLLPLLLPPVPRPPPLPPAPPPPPTCASTARRRSPSGGLLQSPTTFTGGACAGAHRCSSRSLPRAAAVPSRRDDVAALVLRGCTACLNWKAIVPQQRVLARQPDTGGGREARAGVAGKPEWAAAGECGGARAGTTGKSAAELPPPPEAISGRDTPVCHLRPKLCARCHRGR
jgi:hypothetical protein